MCSTAGRRAIPPSSSPSRSAVSTYAEKITPADRLLDPARPASALERVVRALHPHIGARVELPDGSMLGVREARPLDPEPGTPAGPGEGTARGALGVGARDGRLLLDCAVGTLELCTVQPPGARAMSAADYLRGYGVPGRA